MCKLVTIENSNVTRSKLFQTKSYNEFTNKLYAGILSIKGNCYMKGWERILLGKLKADTVFIILSVRIPLLGLCGRLC